VAACDEVAVPSQDRGRAHQQPQSSQHVQRQLVQQSGEEGPVARGEPHLLLPGLALQHRDLVSQRQDLDLFLPIAHRQHTQHHERIRQGQVGESQQHGRSSSRGDQQAREGTTATNRGPGSLTPHTNSHQGG
jgi:hypothetical protein